MDHTNHWYGHAHILAEYCGFDPASPPPIRGVIQHGWTFVHGFGYKHLTDWSMRKFSWSDTARKRGHLLGWRNYIPIGSPFLYLLKLHPDSSEKREGTIWYPFHGTVDYEKTSGNHHELVEQIQATETGPVTVCLYYVEYDNPKIRAVYENAGFRVITHGHRGNQWQGTDRHFLYRQLTELRRHSRVASNRLITAALYGVAAGCELAIYGDPMILEGAKKGFDGTNLLKPMWPDFFGTTTDATKVRKLAMRELGADYVRQPQELKYLLGWEEAWRR